MCVGQPAPQRAAIVAIGSYVKCTDALNGPVVGKASAALLEELVSGLARYPVGAERAAECQRRCSTVASKIAEVQEVLEKVASACSTSESKSAGSHVASISVQWAYGSCVGLQKALEVMNSAGDLRVVTRMSGLVSMQIIACQELADKVQAPVGDEPVRSTPSSPVRQLISSVFSAVGLSTCMAGFSHCEQRKQPAQEVEEAPMPLVRLSPVAKRTSYLNEQLKQFVAAPRILCSDSAALESLTKVSSCTPTVTHIIEDPMEMMRLCSKNLTKGMRIIPGSPKDTMQTLVEEGKAFDVFLLSASQIDILPKELMAPGALVLSGGYFGLEKNAFIMD